MIKGILVKIFSLQTIFYNKKRREGMQKMMANCLQIKPNKLCAIYKIHLPCNYEERNGRVI
jgi:hypothetical protein